MLTTRRALFGMPVAAPSAYPKDEDCTLWAYHRRLGELPRAVHENCIWTRFDGGSKIGWAANFSPAWRWKPPEVNPWVRMILETGLVSRIQFNYPSKVVKSAIEYAARQAFEARFA